MTTLGEKPVNALKPASWAICRSAVGEMPQTRPFQTRQGMRILHQGLPLQLAGNAEESEPEMSVCSSGERRELVSLFARKTLWGEESIARFGPSWQIRTTTGSLLVAHSKPFKDRFRIGVQVAGRYAMGPEL
jgi:hypothetical protein